MCGIAGLQIAADAESIKLILARMMGAINHRGPDSRGSWQHDSLSVGLAHVRLSILDLSPLGHQPMASNSGRYVMSFNGEIYNFVELKNDLIDKDHIFRGGSDTEVMLAAIEEWGLESALKKFNGMFAFALYDLHKNEVFLCRDRLGKKPIYYSHDSSGEWIFCSEIKGLLASGYKKFDIEREALSLFIRYGYIPNPLSILKGVFEVAPGGVVKFDIVSKKKTEFLYWDISDIAVRRSIEAENISKTDVNNQVESIIRDAVKLRMVADVPLGAFLSGGIDSSLVVAIMQSMSAEKIRTYTIGFNDKKYNEAQHAKEVASYLGTEHHELYISEKDLLDVVDGLPAIMDEPLADISILPTFIVSRLAAKDIKVVLSGDGGDEFFCGYEHYKRIKKAKDSLYDFPQAIRKPLGGLLQAVMPHGALRVQRLAAMLRSDSYESLCSSLLSQWQIPSQLVKNGIDTDSFNTSFKYEKKFKDIRRFAMLRDAQRYMVDDILHKVDRASMAVSIEARAPLLDYRLIEYSFGIPLDYLSDGIVGKLPLREILSKYMPRELFERPKKGFGVPISRWLRADLRAWAGDILSSAVIDEFFYREAVDKLWGEHLSERYDRGAYLWNIIVFAHWYQSLFGASGKV